MRLKQNEAILSGLKSGLSDIDANDGAMSVPLICSPETTWQRMHQRCAKVDPLSGFAAKTSFVQASVTSTTQHATDKRIFIPYLRGNSALTCALQVAVARTVPK
jgi:hypothetical protein